jgi:hypothetical protein
MKEQEPYEKKRSYTIWIMVSIFAVAVIFGVIYTYGSFPYKKSEVMPESRPASEESQTDYSTDTTGAAH